MGTSKPLTILIIGDIHPSFVTLREKGHIVATPDARGMIPLQDYDLILGPNCARFVPGMEKFLDSFLAGARKLKYPGKKSDD